MLFKKSMIIVCLLIILSSHGTQRGLTNEELKQEAVLWQKISAFTKDQLRLLNQEREEELRLKDEKEKEQRRLYYEHRSKLIKSQQNELTSQLEQKKEQLNLNPTPEVQIRLEQELFSLHWQHQELKKLSLQHEEEEKLNEEEEIRRLTQENKDLSEQLSLMEKILILQEAQNEVMLRNKFPKIWIDNLTPHQSPHTLYQEQKKRTLEASIEETPPQPRKKIKQNKQASTHITQPKPQPYKRTRIHNQVQHKRLSNIPERVCISMTRNSRTPEILKRDEKNSKSNNNPNFHHN